MTVDKIILRGLGLALAIGLTQVPVRALGQEKLFDQLPDAASEELGGADIAQVLVFTKEGQLNSWYGRSVGSPERVEAPPGLSISVENVDDPAKDIIVTATIPRSSLQVPGEPTEPVEVIPAIFVKVGTSTCGWVYSGSGGGEVCQRVCW